MTQFQILFDALDLWKAGRKNAAKSQWSSLTSEFREKIIEYLIRILPVTEPLVSTVKVRTKFGILEISDSFVRDLKTHLPEILGV